MKTINSNLLRSSGALALIAGIGFLLPATQVKAQDDQAYPMAPPVSNYAPTESVNNVFNWQDVPQNQVVPIDRAVFDQGGYQLYDDAGETIVVPFQNNNLYVMKFAVSQTGQTYFVNDAGQAPILYVPRGAYLENATVPGARWYPFNQRFAPSSPVFLGIAPSYSAFVGMGWYPDELCYGGYYGDVSFVEGGFFGPTLGLTFIFGGHSYDGWNGYRRYAEYYPAPYHLGYFNRDDYRIGGRPNLYRRDSFIGSNGQRFHPSTGSISGRPSFGGSAFRPGFGGSAGSGFRGATSRPSFGGTASRPGFGGTTSRPGFGGGTASRPGFGGGTSRPGFGGGTSHPGFGGATSRPGFGGATSNPGFGGATSRPGFGGATSRPSFGGATSRPSFGGGTAPRSGFGGATSRPSFGGGSAPRGGGFGGATPRSGGTPSGGGSRGGNNDQHPNGR